MKNTDGNSLPNESNNEHYTANLPQRHRMGSIWRIIFQISTVIGMVVLVALLWNVMDSTMGYAAIENAIEPEDLAINDIPLEQLHPLDLTFILKEHISANVFKRLETENPFAERSRDEIYQLVIDRVVEPQVEATWSLSDSLFRRQVVFSEAAEKFPNAEVQFISWLDRQFITTPQSDTPELAGVRTGILGSLWVIAITISFSLPLGVGAAIYLEEYASTTSRINRIIQTNINNLAGVPSIIYGMLGLAIFVRVLETFTSGNAFGVVEDPTTANGRTIISAGLTLGLLILPVIIINAQEAIKAVPQSLRQAAFGLGATRWQTVWHHVLPSALPGIMTGTILAVSRAIGETAPLVVVGASTFITFDPDGPFSKFTVLPIQIYQWTARPQGEFHNLAAAAIIVLLILLLSLNTTAVIIRNRFTRRF